MAKSVWTMKFTLINTAKSYFYDVLQQKITNNTLKIQLDKEAKIINEISKLDYKLKDLNIRK